VIHSPQCETWDVHARRCHAEIEGWMPLADLVDQTLHSWEQELLLNDPEFDEDFHRLLADVAEAQDEEAVA